MVTFKVTIALFIACVLALMSTVSSVPVIIISRVDDGRDLMEPVFKPMSKRSIYGMYRYIPKVTKTKKDYELNEIGDDEYGIYYTD
uniref:Venom peptide n=1 Tax=Panagrellus redivivus TaxID=6233 RepID=A0A7E4ZW80_PANRE